MRILFIKECTILYRFAAIFLKNFPEVTPRTTPIGRGKPPPIPYSKTHASPHVHRHTFLEFPRPLICTVHSQKATDIQNSFSATLNTENLHNVIIKCPTTH